MPRPPRWALRSPSAPATARPASPWRPAPPWRPARSCGAWLADPPQAATSRRAARAPASALRSMVMWILPGQSRAVRHERDCSPAVALSPHPPIGPCSPGPAERRSGPGRPGPVSSPGPCTLHRIYAQRVEDTGGAGTARHEQAMSAEGDHGTMDATEITAAVAAPGGRRGAVRQPARPRPPARPGREAGGQPARPDLGGRRPTRSGTTGAGSSRTASTRSRSSSRSST